MNKVISFSHTIGQEVTRFSDKYLQPSYFFQREVTLLKPPLLGTPIRFLETILPLVSLYSPATRRLSYAVSGWNGFIAFARGNWWATMRNTVELAATYFEMRAALFLHTSLNLLESTKNFVWNFKPLTTWRGFENVLKVAGNALYLLTLVKSTRKNHWKFTVASLAFQGAYQLLQSGRQPYVAQQHRASKERFFSRLDALCKLVMSGARFYQASVELNRHQMPEIIPTPVREEPARETIPMDSVTPSEPVREQTEEAPNDSTPLARSDNGRRASKLI